MHNALINLAALDSAITAFGWALALLPLVVLAFGRWYRGLGNITQRSEWTEGLTFSTAGAEASFFGPMRRHRGRFVSRLQSDYCGACKGQGRVPGRCCASCDGAGSFDAQGRVSDIKAATMAPADLFTLQLRPWGQHGYLAALRSLGVPFAAGCLADTGAAAANDARNVRTVNVDPEAYPGVLRKLGNLWAMAADWTDRVQTGRAIGGLDTIDGRAFEREALRD